MLRSALIRTRSLYGAVLVVLFLALLSACQGSQPAAETPVEPTSEATVAAEATEPPAEEATEVPEEEATAPAEEEITTTEEMTGTEEMTATEEMTDSAEMTSTEEMTATDTSTETTSSATGEMTGDPANGAYIATLTGGCGCHMNRDLGALAGGNEFEVPTGIVYASNITPDEATGIGSWTEADIARVLQIGATPDEQLHPVMPYMALSALSDQEALDVAAYLLSLEPVANEVPARELTEEPAAFTPANASPAEQPTEPIARGEELVIITQCGSCHTPKNEDGSANTELMLAGGPLRDEIASNITPDEETGIGTWTEEEIATLLRTGMEPSGEQIEGAMAQQIERRFSTLTEEDALAIAAYLKSIPAISNDPYAQ